MADALDLDELERLLDYSTFVLPIGADDRAGENEPENLALVTAAVNALPSLLRIARAAQAYIAAEKACDEVSGDREESRLAFYAFDALRTALKGVDE